MSKRFLNSMLVGLLFIVGASSMFTSCKDYDDDIKNLQEQIDKNAKAIDQINSLVTDGSVISDVRKVADGIEVVMANGTTYKITNGTNATVWTIGDDGYWYKDGEKTDYYAIGKDGANGINGTDGTNGTNGTNGKDGKDGIYYVPNPETGCWDIYNGDGTLKENTNISWKAATNEITAVKDGSDLKLYNVRTTNGYADFTVALSNVLRGFVFQPEVYVDGVPAIRVASFGYKALNMSRMDNGVNGPNGLEEYTTATSTTYKSRKTYVKYHVNPSNANVEDLKNLTFVVKANDEYIRTRAPKKDRASSDFNAEAKFMDFSNGILTVEVVVYGEPATDEHISVIALQTVREDGENVTSDYATVVKSNLNDIHIADKARFQAGTDYHFRTILHSKDASCDHIGIKEYAVTHMNDTTGESCDLQLKYNDKNGINIWDYVMAHEIADPCRDATSSLSALGFTWKLELMKNFKYGANETDQAEYVSFDPVTGILKVDGYKESAIDRTPVIRVRIMDGEKTVKVAYIKVKIVRDTPEPIVDYTEAFILGNSFVFNCSNENQHMISYDYKDFSIQILDANGWSKADFHTLYPEAYDITTVPFDFKDPNTGNTKRVNKEAGWVKERLNEYDQLEEGTHVLEWYITSDELWNLAEDSENGGKPVTVYNRFRYHNSQNGRYFDIVLVATIQPIKKTFHVDETSYITNYWFENYAYTKLNVNVPNPENSTDHTKCIFENDLNAAFVTQSGFIKLKETGVTGLHYMFCNDMTAKGYTIKNNGTELYYGNNLICWLENAPAYNQFRYNKNNDKAKELLNRGDMEVYLAVKGLICGKYEVGVRFRNNADHFVAKVIRPVTLSGNNVHPDYFIDGVDYGEAHSYVDCDQFLNRLVDWRDRDFANHPTFWEYYGPFTCAFHTNTAVCNLKVNGVEAWRPIPNTIDFKYEPTPWLGHNNRFGWLTYKNNGTNVDDDFYIKVDLDIIYGWGTYTIEGVQILVQSTKNTPAN